MKLTHKQHVSILKKKKRATIIFTILCLVFSLMALGIASVRVRLITKSETNEIISPCPFHGCSDVNMPIKDTVMPFKRPTIGKASYYSRAGCLGCSKTLTMANGQPLDDTRITIAYNYAKMNTPVKVRNLDNNKQVNAIVTDTGGFHKYNRIADLSLATKQAINCTDLCQIELEF